MGPALRLAGVLLVLFLVPGVAACSFAGPGPDLPARIWVWDIEAAETVDTVDLWSRGLDGDCGLVQPVDLDDGRLVYADQAGDSMGVWLRLVGEDRPPRLVFRLDGHYNDLDLDGDLLSIYMYTERSSDGPDGRTRYHHIFTVDLATGDAARVPVDVDWLGNPTIEDGLLYWDWVSRDDYRHRFNLYDLHNGEWVHENVSIQDTFGLGDRPRVVQMNARWILFQDQEGTHAWDRQTERLTALDRPLGYRGDLDGDRLYMADHQDRLQVYHLPEGPLVPLPDVGKPVFRNSVFDDGLVVLGVYSADGPKTPPSWMREPQMTEDFPIPPEWQHERPPWYTQLPGAPAPLVALLAGGLLARRRSMRSPR